jgi:hypothetical protein
MCHSRQADEAFPALDHPEPELDWYEEKLRDEEQAVTDRVIVWVDGLTADEIEELKQ